MALFFASLNSGSNANCYYVGTKEYGVLVDAGLSAKQTAKRLEHLGLSLAHIRAIFISHEHIDHVNGLAELANAIDHPVYITNATFARFRQLKHGKNIHFCCGDSIKIQDMAIHAFGKMHDGIDPHSFVVERAGVRVGVFTDIGNACEKLKHHFSHCHAAILESNYDEKMLHNGRYPPFLKHRIRGEKGHLSNHQALELFRNHKSPFLQTLVLGHLSKENNHPDIVRDLFEEHCGNVKIHVASRDTHSQLFFVSQIAYHGNIHARKAMLKPKVGNSTSQLSFSF